MKLIESYATVATICVPLGPVSWKVAAVIVKGSIAVLGNKLTTGLYQ
jgi:hypothetical protein